MIRVSLFACLLAVRIASPALAQDIDCETAMAQQELNACAEQDWEAADADLNDAYKRAMAEMKDMDDSAQRASIIDRMNRILQNDAPWVFGFHPKDFTLAHRWLHNRKPHEVANNTLKYQRIDVAERERLRREWNPPLLWPLAILGLAAAGVIVPAVVAYRRRERRTVTR